jgi:hypothetical protein
LNTRYQEKIQAKQTVPVVAFLQAWVYIYTWKLERESGQRMQILQLPTFQAQGILWCTLYALRSNKIVTNSKRIQSEIEIEMSESQAAIDAVDAFNRSQQKLKWAITEEVPLVNEDDLNWIRDPR